MFKTLTRRIGMAMVLVAAYAPAALADWEVNMPVGVTPLSREMHGLHMLIFWVCVAIAVVVFGVMIYSIFAFRRSKGAQPDTTMYHSTTAEIVWTVIPIVILVVMAVPAAKALVKIEDTRAPDITVKVTGYQWKWHYEYLGEGVSFFSSLDRKSNEIRQVKSGRDPFAHEAYLREVDKRMVVPVNKKVRILLTSNDVLHAWWVPELGGKKDAIPGFVNEMWFQAEQIGTYRGQCAELCGRDHGFMPIVVDVVSEADYAAWVAQQSGGAGQGAVAASTGVAEPAAAAAAEASGEGPADAMPATDVAAPDGGDLDMDTLMAAGETKYKTYCSACHQVNGRGLPPTFPSMVGSAVVTGPLAGHLDIVINGKQGTAMAAFGAQLNDEDIAAIITYQRNAWGNDTGDVVQPAAVADAR